jgi:hypothetical protein
VSNVRILALKIPIRTKIRGVEERVMATPNPYLTFSQENPSHAAGVASTVQVSMPVSK